MNMKCERLANTYCNKCDLYYPRRECNVAGKPPEIPTNLGKLDIYNPYKKFNKMKIKYSPTTKEIEDYIKCINDPLYFATKCFVKTPNGIIPYDKYCKLKLKKSHTVKIEK